MPTQAAYIAPAAADMKAEMHVIEHRLADPAVPSSEHETMLHRYSELQDRPNYVVKETVESLDE